MQKKRKGRRRKADTLANAFTEEDRRTWSQLLRTEGREIDATVKQILSALKYDAHKVDEISQDVLLKLTRITETAPPPRTVTPELPLADLCMLRCRLVEEATADL